MNTEQKISGLRSENWEQLREILEGIQKQIYAIEERIDSLEND